LEEEAEGGLAVKFSRLSGAALAVAALVAAMVASAAYGIGSEIIAGGQLGEVSCISVGGADTCTSVGTVPMSNPTGLGLTSDGSRLFVAANSSDTVAIFKRDRASGALVPWIKPNCMSESGAAPCSQGHGLSGPVDVAGAGASAFVISSGSDALTSLTKDGQSGEWKYVGCLSQPAADTCTAGRALTDPSAVLAVGSFVYVGGPSTLAVFKVGEKSTLKQVSGTAGCITPGGVGGCADNNGHLSGAVQDMATSRDGKSLYVVDGTSLLTYSRDLSTGELTFSASTAMSNPTGVDLSPNSQFLYVAAQGGNAVEVFSRDKTGALTHQSSASVAAPSRLIVHKSGRVVYVVSGDAVVNFKRDPRTGALTQLPGQAGCISETGSGGSCMHGSGLAGGSDILSTGTNHVYVSGTTFNSVAVMKINRSS
jgi:DNA-binding beta-propeller fold protein YncE